MSDYESGSDNEGGLDLTKRASGEHDPEVADPFARSSKKKKISYNTFARMST